MLKFAKLYEKELTQLYYNNITDVKYQWINCNYNGALEINNDDWNTIQRVSLDNETSNIIGFLEGRVVRSCNKISELLIFSNANTLREYKIFEADLLDYMIYLLTNFRKLEFSVVVGNPVRKKYHQFLKVVGGRVIGTYTKSCRINGQLYDDERYELISTPEVISKVKELRSRIKI